MFIPETSRGEKPQEGWVLEVSDDNKLGLQRGDHVVFSKYSGSVIEVDTIAVLVLHEEDVIAKRKLQ